MISAKNDASQGSTSYNYDDEGSLGLSYASSHYLLDNIPNSSFQTEDYNGSLRLSSIMTSFDTYDEDDVTTIVRGRSPPRPNIKTLVIRRGILPGAVASKFHSDSHSTNTGTRISPNVTPKTEQSDDFQLDDTSLTSSADKISANEIVTDLEAQHDIDAKFEEKPPLFGCIPVWLTDSSRDIKFVIVASITLFIASIVLLSLVIGGAVDGNAEKNHLQNDVNENDYIIMSPSAEPITSPSTVSLSATSEVPYSLLRNPSSVPSRTPSHAPSTITRGTPSVDPSIVPSTVPSVIPSRIPSAIPSAVPTSIPSMNPSSGLSTVPSRIPSLRPSTIPSAVPTTSPSMNPSSGPSTLPSRIPNLRPSTMPSVVPTIPLSTNPSSRPSTLPSEVPNLRPSTMPSVVPTIPLSINPSSGPSTLPSVIPSWTHSTIPSAIPTSLTSSGPSSSRKPADAPSAPSGSPSANPLSATSTFQFGIPSGTPNLSVVPTNSTSSNPLSNPSTL